MTMIEEITMTTEENSAPAAADTVIGIAQQWAVTAQRDELQRQLAERNAQLGRTSSLLEETRGRVGDLTNERDSLQRRLSQALSDEDTTLERFKEQVVDVATRYAEEHNMCSVIDQALGELGLRRAPNAYTAELTITVRFIATMTNRRDEPDASWVRDSVRFNAIQNAIEESFSMDADHTSSEITDIDYDIDNVEMDED